MATARDLATDKKWTENGQRYSPQHHTDIQCHDAIWCHQTTYAVFLPPEARVLLKGVRISNQEPINFWVNPNTELIPVEGDHALPAE